MFIRGHDGPEPLYSPERKPAPAPARSGGFAPEWDDIYISSPAYFRPGKRPGDYTCRHYAYMCQLDVRPQKKLLVADSDRAGYYRPYKETDRAVFARLVHEGKVK